MDKMYRVHMILGKFHEVVNKMSSTLELQSKLHQAIGKIKHALSYPKIFRDMLGQGTTSYQILSGSGIEYIQVIHSDQEI